MKNGIQLLLGKILPLQEKAHLGAREAVELGEQQKKPSLLLAQPVPNRPPDQLVNALRLLEAAVLGHLQHLQMDRRHPSLGVVIERLCLMLVEGHVAQLEIMSNIRRIKPKGVATQKIEPMALPKFHIPALNLLRQKNHMQFLRPVTGEDGDCLLQRAVQQLKIVHNKIGLLCAGDILQGPHNLHKDVHRREP